MTESPDPLGPRVHSDLQEPALHVAASDLQRDFSEMFGVETIERFLLLCYDELAERATIANYLPLLAERFARQRLNAVARVEGKIEPWKTHGAVLCTHNAGRSQMARGFFARLAGDRAAGLVRGIRTRQPNVKSRRRRGNDRGRASISPRNFPSPGLMRS